ncbi:hypothetical protein AB0395_20120 [Streptosporangium sp. NPDC051023]
MFTAYHLVDLRVIRAPASSRGCHRAADVPGTVKAKVKAEAVLTMRWGR